MHNILYVTTSSHASPTGGGRTRVVSESRQVIKFGFQVILLCFLRPDQIFPLRKLLNGRRKLAAEAVAKVYYLPRLPGTRNSIIEIINCWYSALVIFTIASMYHIKVIHAHGTIAAYYALIARKINSRLKVVSDIHGATVEEYMFSNGLLFLNSVARTLQKKVRQVLGFSDHIVFVSHAMQRFYSLITIENSLSSVIPCAVNTEQHLAKNNREKLRRRFGLDNKLVFFYLGSGEDYQLPRQMCHLVSLVRRKIPETHFFILSHHRDIFLKYLSDEGIPEANYSIDAVAHTQVPELLQLGDVGLMLRDDEILNRVSSPTKLAEYFLSGLPVITTKFVGDYSEMINRHNLGLVLNSLEDLDIEAELLDFIKNVMLQRDEWAARCLQFAEEHLSWKIYGPVIAKAYQDLLSS